MTHQGLDIGAINGPRGLPAAISGGGPYNAGTTHMIAAGGKCGIPSTQTAGVSLSFTVFNYTVNNGGYITFKTVGAPIAGNNAVFNVGAQWIAATGNVSTLDDSGNFDIYIAQSNVEVIVDVNGYFADIDGFIDAGNDFPGIITSNATASWVGYNSAAGAGLYGFANGGGAGLLGYSATGPALRLLNGTVEASGAGTNTNTFAFRVVVNTADWPGGNRCSATFPNYMVLDNPQLNGRAGALVYAVAANGDSPPDPVTSPLSVWYESAATGFCANGNGAGHMWLLKADSGGSFVNNSLYHIMVIQP